jgi:hypothetical protein
MNKAFTNNTKIVLDDSWYVESDGDSGIVLTFHETRQREKTTKVDGKTVKTGEVEDYTFTDVTYHTRICQALRRYVDKVQNGAKNLKELIEKTDKINNIIDKLDKEFRQFN